MDETWCGSARFRCAGSDPACSAWREPEMLASECASGSPTAWGGRAVTIRTAVRSDRRVERNSWALRRRREGRDAEWAGGPWAWNRLRRTLVWAFAAGGPADPVRAGGVLSSARVIASQELQARRPYLDHHGCPDTRRRSGLGDPWPEGFIAVLLDARQPAQGQPVQHQCLRLYKMST